MASPVWDWQHGGERAWNALEGVTQGFNPVTGYQRINRETNAAVDALMHGDVRSLAYHAAGAVPFFGEPAQQIGTEVGKGEYAKGFGHAVGLVGSIVALPEAYKTISEAGKAIAGKVPTGVLANIAGAAPEPADIAAAGKGAVTGGFKGLGKGLQEAASKERTTAAGIAGGIGYGIAGRPGAEIGAGMVGGAPIIYRGMEGAYQGARAALAARRAGPPAPEIVAAPVAPQPLAPFGSTGVQIHPLPEPTQVHVPNLAQFGTTGQRVVVPQARAPAAPPDIAPIGQTGQSVNVPQSFETNIPLGTRGPQGGYFQQSWSAAPAEASKTPGMRLAESQGINWGDLTKEQKTIFEQFGAGQTPTGQTPAVQPPSKFSINPKTWEESPLTLKDRNAQFHARGKDLDVPAIRTPDGKVLAASPPGSYLSRGTMTAIVKGLIEHGALPPDTVIGGMTPPQFDLVDQALEDMANKPGKARGGVLREMERKAYDRATGLRALGAA
jgi:hypothetical protein